MQKKELRLDPLTQAWTIFSAARAARPAFPSIRQERSEPCLPDPFLAGREWLAPHALHTSSDSGSWKVRVVPNRTPLLGVEGNPFPRADGFYDRMDGVGAHEIIIETPDARAFEELPRQDVEKVIEAWKLRMLDLMRDSRMRSFTVVKDVGRPAGGLVNHAVSQLLAMAFVAPALKQKLRSAREFYHRKRRSLFEDLLAEEFRTGARLVYENNGFTVFCPYASRGPFEMAIYPKRQCPDFHGLSDQEMAQFADVLRAALRKLARALGHPAYSLMLSTAPTRTPRADHWGTIEQDFRWHVEILPRLHGLGGIELGAGCWINSVWPEVAAEYLRSIDPEEELDAGSRARADP